MGDDLLMELGRIDDWILAAVPDGLWVLDDAGTTVWANARFTQMLGRTPEEMVGLSAYDALDASGREQLGDHLERLRVDREPGADLECLLVRADGSTFWAQVSHAPLVDGAGGHRGWLHRVRDHTAQRAIVEELERREV
jgi:hypothetical protein